MIDETTKFNRAEGYYKRDASMGNVDGSWKNFVARAKVQRSEMDNFNTPDLDQGADSILRPGETLEDDFDVTFRKPNAQGGFQQLVKNTDNGSRPGYKGKPYLDQKKFIEEFTKQRIDGNKTTAEFVEYLNDNYKPSSQTDKFNIGNVDRRMRVLQEKGLIPTDIVTKGSKADLALTPKKYISLLGEEGYAAVKDNPTLLKSRYEYAREMKNNPNFLDQRKIRRQNWVDSLSPEEYEEKVAKPARIKNAEKRGNFPKFTVDRKNSKSMMWKDLVSRTYETKGQPYFEFETPLESGKNYNTADMKKIVLIDKNGNRFTYDTLFDDVKKIAGEAEFKNFKNTYDQRAFMNKEGITTELNKLYGNKPGSMKSVFNIQHIEGFNKNPFKVHMTFADQNLNEAYSRRTFTAEFGKADTYSKKKIAINNYYNSLGEDIVAQIGKKPKGESKTLINLLDKTGIKLTDSQITGATSLDEVMKKIKNTDPKLAKKVDITLNSGIPVNQMLEEIRKIPGIDKLGKGFMKVGGPFEVAFLGLDTVNELSKGKDFDESFKTAVQNLTFGAYKGGDREKLETLSDAATELNLDSTGFAELRKTMELTKQIESVKKVKMGELASNDQSLTNMTDQEVEAYYNNKINKLQTEINNIGTSLKESGNFDTLINNYTEVTKYVAGKQYDKGLEGNILTGNRRDRVFPGQGDIGSGVSSTISDFRSLLPQNFLQNSITGVIPDILSKTPFVGKYFEPTSDRAKLFKMNEADKEKRLNKIEPSIKRQIEKNYYSEGGITGLRSKYEYKK